MEARGLEFQLLNAFQRDFPLVSRPFAALAQSCRVTERQIIDTLARLFTYGFVSRVGAVFAPGRIGASTLVAIAVSERRIAAVATELDALDGVNHSYEREHLFNLWAVVTAQDETALSALLSGIERSAGLAVLDLRLVREYRIDLGFDLADGRSPRPQAAVLNAERARLTAPQRRLVAALQDGIELVDEPFRALGARAGLSEEDVLSTLAAWCADGTIRRFGVIVRHRELGYRANAMAVWDVPDDLVDAIGERIAAAPEVTLAYRRRRRPPLWNYNLFCMVHGKERSTVTESLARIGREHGLDVFPHAVLFSRRRFKQTGAHYVSGEALLAHG